jgi:alpha-glucosidase
MRDAHMAGFTDAADAWLPLDPRHRALAADVQEQDPESVLAFARGMIALRRASPALRHGSFVAYDQAPEGVLAFERESPDQKVLCFFNLSGDSARISTPPIRKVLLDGLGWVSGGAPDATLGGYSALFVEV